jgi:hypothetical protein
MKINHPTALALLLLLGTTFQTFAGTSAPELPIQRVLSDLSGRKLEVTILEKHDTTVKVRRSSDSKIYSLDLDKLSAEDREFANGLRTTPPASAPQSSIVPPGQTQIEMAVCGSRVQVTRVGNGPLGVIFFGHTGWRSEIPTIVNGAAEFDGLLPEKASFFLWDYPHEGPFKENSRALDEYDEGDTGKFRPDFKGIATKIVAQIRQQTGITQFLLVGNSLGAGVILWDYPELVKDSSVKFLLISPTEPFMPLVSDLVKLQRTMLLTGVEDPTGQNEFPDDYMKGKDACRWAKANTDTSAIKKLNESLSDPARSRHGITLPQRGNLNGGHIIIGSEIKLPVLGRLIKVNLGLAPSSLLAKP